MSTARVKKPRRLKKRPKTPPTVDEKATIQSARDAARAVREYKALIKGTMRLTGEEVGRNDPCPCESGKKFKHCCQKPPAMYFILSHAQTGAAWKDDDQKIMVFRSRQKATQKLQTLNARGWFVGGMSTEKFREFSEHYQDHDKLPLWKEV